MTLDIDYTAVISFNSDGKTKMLQTKLPLSSPSKFSQMLKSRYNYTNLRLVRVESAINSQRMHDLCLWNCDLQDASRIVSAVSRFNSRWDVLNTGAVTLFPQDVNRLLKMPGIGKLGARTRNHTNVTAFCSILKNAVAISENRIQFENKNRKDSAVLTIDRPLSKLPF